MAQAGNGEHIRGQEAVLSLMRGLQATGEPIRVRMAGRALEFGTEIIGVDGSGEGSILVDSLIPKEGNRLVERAEGLLLQFYVDGVPHQAASRFLRVEGGEFRAIRLALPEAVERRQRRSYFRVEVSPLRPLAAQVTVGGPEGEKTVETRLLNLSAGGASFRLEGFPGEVHLNDRIPAVSFALPGAGRIRAAARVRGLWEQVDALGRKRKVCGVQFVGLDPAVRERIYRYTLAVQRQARRHEL